jgi:single-stranded DNA-binding protein
MQMLGGRGDDAPARPAQGGFRENAPAPKQSSSKAEEKSPVFQGEDNFTDDDIPF